MQRRAAAKSRAPASGELFDMEGGGGASSPYLQRQSSISSVSLTTASLALPAPQSRREKELAATRRLLDQAESLLSAVDESEFMQARRPRQYPTFDRSEVHLGPLLGVGGFGIVFEIKGLSLKLPMEVESSNDSGEETPPAGAREDGPGQSTNDSTLARMATPVKPISLDESQTTTSTAVRHETDPIDQDIAKVSPLDEAHYEVTTAREYMRENVRRSGDARFAIKRLHRDLRDLDRVRGMIDLAIEAKFLSAVWHPNVGTCGGLKRTPYTFAHCLVLTLIGMNSSQDERNWVRLPVES
jgi:hypothetical protein